MTGRRRAACAVLAAAAAAAPAAPAPAQQQIPSRVEIAWNRFYDYDEITAAMHDLARAYPELLTLVPIGSSEKGREMWVAVLNNPATGPDTVKPAMWIDGNVHGNEIQAAETVLYSMWYLTKSYGEVVSLTELMDRCAFYFLPMVNPDGRATWFAEPNTSSSRRSGQRPTDNDYDGQLDEDGPDDLDGDGHIGVMWRHDPNGTHRRHPDDPRILQRVRPPLKGSFSFAGSEGIDDDGDGRINEDGPGGYDMNRNWPSDWQPNYVQFGAGDHPFSYPETRAVGQFILDHPNIAAGQSYHNAGGMILRGPGASYRERLYDRADRAVYAALSEAGEEMLPFYDYMVIHADLYTVHGGFINWIAEGLGIVGFTNELWSNDRVMQDEGTRLDELGRRRWQDRVLFGQTVTDYTEHDHPTLGRVLIGGGTKFSSRTPPPFMLEEECHRNFAFTMFHAENMPLLELQLVAIERRGDRLWEITLEVGNDRIIPTRVSLAASRGIGLPDRLELAGDGVTVVASGRLSDRFDRTLEPTEHRPEVIRVEAGIPGRGQRAFRFVVTGDQGDEVTVRYEAQKARDVEMAFVLEESDEG